MQRKLLVLAIAGVFGAPAAMAADGNVSIYGTASASFDITNNGAAVNGQSANKLSSNESNLGVKGSTDLGSGYTAMFQVESAIALDGTPAANATATTAPMLGTKLAGRDTFLGLSGSFGTVLAGTHDTPYKMATRNMDVFANTLADNRSLTSLHNSRVGNVLAYISPKISDSTTIAAALVMGAETPAGAAPIKGSAASIAAMYASGPISAAVAYQTVTLGSAGTGSLAVNGINTFYGTAYVANDKLSAFKVGAGYTMDKLTVNLGLERATYSPATPGALSTNQTNLYIGGKYGVSSNGTVKAAYGKMGSTAAAGALANGATQISIGYDHSLAKSTTVYALYTKLSNDAAGTAGLGQTADGEITGATLGGAKGAPSAISVGMKYSF
ncbi:MAG TPA: porin [Gallionellaceae bacterium]